MKKLLPVTLILIFLLSCEDQNFVDHEAFPMLSLEDIKREYATADSLNRLEDKGDFNHETIILGIDERNNQTIIRTPATRGFGCIIYDDYLTILYLNCDSACCETRGFWLIDYMGFAGTPSPVGCAPDTTQQIFESECDCEN